MLIKSYRRLIFWLIQSGLHRQFAGQVKPIEAFADANTIEKLELEWHYWQLKQVPWFFITEHEIDPVIRQNIEWLYPVKPERLVEPELLAQLPVVPININSFR